MIFRLAKENEKEIVLNLYKTVLGEENCVWDECYPSYLEVEEDYKANNLFVLEENNEIIAAISIVSKNEMDNFNEWKYTNNVSEIARVIVRKDKRGQNLSIIMLDNISEILINRGKNVIHLAVAIKNKAAVKNYIKYGFEIIAKKFMYNNEYYLCEKNIGDKNE